MLIQIDIQESHAQLLIDFYVSRLQVLRKEILQREQETKEINSILQKLKKINMAEKAAAPVLNNYSDKWPWVKKIQFAIAHENRPLSTKEIVETLTEFEPAFLFDRKRAVASISSILSSKSGENKKFLKVDREFGDFAYTINKVMDAGNNKTVPNDKDEDGPPF